MYVYSVFLRPLSSPIHIMATRSGFLFQIMTLFKNVKNWWDKAIPRFRLTSMNKILTSGSLRLPKSLTFASFVIQNGVAVSEFSTIRTKLPPPKKREFSCSHKAKRHPSLQTSAHFQGINQERYTNVNKAGTTRSARHWSQWTFLRVVRFNTNRLHGISCWFMPRISCWFMPLCHLSDWFSFCTISNQLHQHEKINTVRPARTCNFPVWTWGFK